MSSRTPEAPPFGLLNVHKPPGPTSHDLVAIVRRGSSERRVGHAGTLDPAASGVLVLALGKATRLLEYLTRSSKSYRATVRLGLVTDTYDLQGTVVDQQPLPADLEAAEIQRLLDSQFVGDLLQTPPAYSALKIGGKAAYTRARAGETVALQPRPVTIHAATLAAVDLPDLTLDVTCGPGTYVRSLAHDLGHALGCGATLAALVRLSSGDFLLEKAVTLDVLQAAFEAGQWRDHLLPADLALPGTPQVILDAQAYEDVLHGRPIAAQDAGGLARAYAPDGRFVAVLQADGSRWHPKKVFA